MIKAPYQKEVEKASTSLLLLTVSCLIAWTYLYPSQTCPQHGFKHIAIAWWGIQYITHYSVLTTSSHSYYYGKRNKRWLCSDSNFLHCFQIFFFVFSFHFLIHFPAFVGARWECQCMVLGICIHSYEPFSRFLEHSLKALLNSHKRQDRDASHVFQHIKDVN